MGFPESMQSSTTPILIAGSFTDDAAAQTQKGDGFSVTVSGAGSSANKATITFDREYDGLISFVCTVMNPDMASGEVFVPVIESYTVTADTAGGNVVLRGIDDAGNIEQTFATNTEFHFMCLLSRDT
jgi:hypothetical protein